jgi:hypothetical protein
VFTQKWAARESRPFFVFGVIRNQWLLPPLLPVPPELAPPVLPVAPDPLELPPVESLLPLLEPLLPFECFPLDLDEPDPELEPLPPEDPFELPVCEPFCEPELVPLWLPELPLLPFELWLSGCWEACAACALDDAAYICGTGAAKSPAARKTTDQPTLRRVMRTPSQNAD